MFIESADEPHTIDQNHGRQKNNQTGKETLGDLYKRGGLFDDSFDLLNVDLVHR
ncbi:hypothetical protein ADIS_2530 [Lunatimonas lonarensis]|uniref:Uncharacterized protein n=1 Tax=Lunatimonas lonarensis TaxID=1232681 RepID=R7ZSC4_9BACT|nr:hypothetical protein ADIS_2530 [Lunatimonas lonarensis]